MTNQGEFGKNQGDYGAAIAHLREAILHCILLLDDDAALLRMWNCPFGYRSYVSDGNVRHYLGSRLSFR